MEVKVINLGYFYADGGAMFGAIPKTVWSRRYPSDEQNRCVLAMNIGLIRTDGRIILVDNGIGTKHTDNLKKSYYRFFDLTDLCEVLAAEGIQPEQVTDMVLTHLHFDHCGYSTRYDGKQIVPTFPSATYWVSRMQWENARNPNPLEKDSYFPENMDVVEKEGLLKLIDNDCELCDSIKLRLYGGHTVGQIAVYVQTTDAIIVFAGDVVPLSSHVSPTWISAYDIAPLTTYYERTRMLEEAAANKQILIYYHDIETPCSTIKKINNFFKIGHKVVL